MKASGFKLFQRSIITIAVYLIEETDLTLEEVIEELFNEDEEYGFDDDPEWEIEKLKNHLKNKWGS